MLPASWVKTRTSNLLKMRDTRLRLISMKSTLSRIEKLKAIEAKIQDSLATNKTDYETKVFSTGRFSDIQKYLEGLKISYIPFGMHFEGKQCTNNVEKSELFNEYYQKSSTTISDTNEFSFPFKIIEIKLALKILQTRKSHWPQ